MSVNWESLAPSHVDIPSDLSTPFTIRASPKSDVWRPNPNRNDFNAPAIVTRMAASSFESIQVTVSGKWKTLYDQGGILLVFPGGADTSSPSKSKSWIKAGIENEQGTPMIGVVGAHYFSDWSLTPLLDDSDAATIKFVRKETSLWIYAVHGGKEIGVREITWAFLEDRGGDAEIWIGVYAAKPTPDADDASNDLQVTFKDLKLETRT